MEFLPFPSFRYKASGRIMGCPKFQPVLVGINGCSKVPKAGLGIQLREVCGTAP